MNRDSIVLVIGIIITLLGSIVLLIERRDAWVDPLEVGSTLLISVGTSLISTAVVAKILTHGIEGLPIASIVEALARNSQFIRVNHKAEITLRTANRQIVVTRKHSYALSNPSRYTQTREITLITDGPDTTPDKDSGFIHVIGPDGAIEGELLKEHVRFVDGKHRFSRVFSIRPGADNRFEFVSRETYRLVDRLIWTVQDLCDDLEVRVVNETSKTGSMTVKINHHRERDIRANMRTLRDGNEVLIRFDAEVLPYQGFEVMWDFS